MGKHKKKNKHRSSIQRHHISYEPENVVLCYKKEHWALTLMNRFNPISEGFIKSLRQYIKDNKHRAVRLKKAEYKRQSQK